MNQDIYAGLLGSPSTDFAGVRDGRKSPPFYIDVDLSTARSDTLAGKPLIVNASGNSFYIDANPNDGNAFVEFQDTSFDAANAPLYVSPGVIFKLPFTQFKLTNTAQPGKRLRIVYGIDLDFLPGSVSQVALSGALDINGASNIATLNGVAFVARASCAAKVAGTQHIPFFHNTGLTKVAIDFMEVTTNQTAGGGYFIGLADSTSPGGAAGFSTLTLASIATLQSSSWVAAGIPPNWMYIGQGQANVGLLSYSTNFDSPLILNPGKMIGFALASAASSDVPVYMNIKGRVLP